MTNLSKHYGSVILAVNSFSEFINQVVDEVKDVDLIELLSECQKYLSMIYYQFSSIPQLNSDYYSSKNSISEELKAVRLKRFYFVSEKLQKYFGEYDAYWNIFDPHKPDQDDPSQSLLSNDIAEIYDSLNAYNDDISDQDLTIEQKLYLLRSGFEFHWYDHACKALTAISWLLYNRIDRD